MTCKQESSKSTGGTCSRQCLEDLGVKLCILSSHLKKVIMEGGVVIHPYLKFGGGGLQFVLILS